MQTDFRAIKDFFLANGITWRNQSGEEYVPAQKEIEIKVLEMLNTAANSASGYYKSVSGNMLVRKSNVSIEFGVFLIYKSV